MLKGQAFWRLPFFCNFELINPNEKIFSASLFITDSVSGL